VKSWRRAAVSQFPIAALIRHNFAGDNLSFRRQPERPFFGRDASVDRTDILLFSNRAFKS
jgi:hypothetical protein